MNLYPGVASPPGRLPMPDIIPIPPRYPVIPLFLNRQLSNLNHLILSSFLLSRAPRGRVAKSHSGNPRGPSWRCVARFLQICCRFAARKTEKPRVSAANGANLLQIRCRFSKRVAARQGFCGFRPASIRRQQRERQGRQALPPASPGLPRGAAFASMRRRQGAAMTSGPLVATYPLAGRSRAIVVGGAVGGSACRPAP